MPMKFQEKSRDGFGKFLQRERGVGPDNNGASRRAISAIKSPSAWALSPGRRSLGSPMGSESPAKVKGGGGVGGGVTKILSTSSKGKCRRFVNASAEAAMATVKKVGEIQLLLVWLRILMLRKIIIQKRIEMQRVKYMMKLYQIINPQLSLLNEWAKLERRNQESIGRLATKLSALSTSLPLTHGLKAEAESVDQALNTAINVMGSIKPLITKYQTQVERILYQITELITASKQEDEYLQELLGIIPMIVTLLENEKCIQVHLIQTKM